MPQKFGYDKRKAHLSSLIVSGQMTRDQALVEMKEPAYPVDQLEEDREFICKKLLLSESNFNELLNISNTHFSAYPSNSSLKSKLSVLKRILLLPRRAIRKLSSV